MKGVKDKEKNTEKITEVLRFLQKAYRTSNKKQREIKSDYILSQGWLRKQQKCFNKRLISNYQKEKND